MLPILIPWEPLLISRKIQAWKSEFLPAPMPGCDVEWHLIASLKPPEPTRGGDEWIHRPVPEIDRRRALRVRSSSSRAGLSFPDSIGHRNTRIGPGWISSTPPQSCSTQYHESKLRPWRSLPCHQSFFYCWGSSRPLSCCYGGATECGRTSQNCCDLHHRRFLTHAS